MDRKMKEAAVLKESKRKQVAKLMSLFEALKSRNLELPSAVQLTKDDFELDPSLRIEAETKLKEKLELIQKQNQWDVAKAMVQNII